MRKTWEAYYKSTRSLKPSATLIRALDLFDAKPGIALDLGCGAGRDTVYLLEKGFSVTAVDKDSGAEEYIGQLPHQEKLKFICAGFDEFTYGHYDIVNAQYSLPFAGKAVLDSVMRKMVASINPGGLFVGQLFGNDDEWNVPGAELAFHYRHDIERFFGNFVSLQVREVNRDGHMANGKPKHWHVFNIVAQK